MKKKKTQTTHWNTKPNHNWINWESKSTEEKSIIQSSLNQEDKTRFHNWLRENYYKKLECFSISNHKQPCNCVYCSVYRNRMRKKCQHPVKRYQRPR